MSEYQGPAAGRRAPNPGEKRFVVSHVLDSSEAMEIYAADAKAAAVIFFKIKPGKWTITVRAKRTRDFFYSDICEMLPEADDILAYSEAEKDSLAAQTMAQHAVRIMPAAEKKKMLAARTAGIVLIIWLLYTVVRVIVGQVIDLTEAGHEKEKMAAAANDKNALQKHELPGFTISLPRGAFDDDAKAQAQNGSMVMRDTPIKGGFIHLLWTPSPDLAEMFADPDTWQGMVQLYIDQTQLAVSPIGHDKIEVNGHTGAVAWLLGKGKTEDAKTGAFLSWFCPETQRAFSLSALFPTDMPKSKKLIENILSSVSCHHDLSVLPKVGWQLNISDDDFGLDDDENVDLVSLGMDHLKFKPSTNVDFAEVLLTQDPQMMKGFELGGARLMNMDTFKAKNGKRLGVLFMQVGTGEDELDMAVFAISCPDGLSHLVTYMPIWNELNESNIVAMYNKLTCAPSLADVILPPSIRTMATSRCEKDDAAGCLFEAFKRYDGGEKESARELFKKSCDLGNKRACGSLTTFFKAE